MSNKTTQKRVLIVDDDVLQIKLLSEILTKEGYSVESTAEAAEGLQKAIHSLPDCIVLDVMMPVINGYNFCKLLKAEEKQKHIPVIMVTARDDAEDRKIGEEVGANAYLTKPIDTQMLLQTIGQFLKPSNT